MNSAPARIRGITLLEILIVVAVILVLITTLGLVIGPIAKRSAYHARIRADLRQISAAINLYKSDNDDQYPSYLRNLGDAGYAYPRGIPELKDMPGAMRGEPEYYLTYTWGCRQVEERRRLIQRFDPQKDAVVKALFYPIDAGKGPSLEFVNPQVGFRWITEPVPRYRVLGVSLDGRVSWSPMRSPWEDEYAYYMFGVLQEASDEGRQRK